ncbi:hypothetical protein KCP77_03345 [Salmonella enterica subsp. enterica]|nr:hypothetical protein KCP77_03345 [Salmonella enterica subsp. enterica]
MQQAEAIRYSGATYRRKAGWHMYPASEYAGEMNIQPSSGEINAAELVSVMELKTPVVLPRTSLIPEMEVMHEKYRISIFAGLWFNFIGTGH